MNGATVPGTYCFGTYTVTLRVYGAGWLVGHHQTAPDARVRSSRTYPRPAQCPDRTCSPPTHREHDHRPLQHALRIRNPHLRSRHMRRPNDEVPILIRRRNLPIRQLRRLHIPRRMRITSRRRRSCARLNRSIRLPSRRSYLPTRPTTHRCNCKQSNHPTNHSLHPTPFRRESSAPLRPPRPARPESSRSCEGWMLFQANKFELSSRNTSPLCGRVFLPLPVAAQPEEPLPGRASEDRTRIAGTELQV